MNEYSPLLVRHVASRRSVVPHLEHVPSTTSQSLTANAIRKVSAGSVQLS